MGLALTDHSKGALTDHSEGALTDHCKGPNHIYLSLSPCQSDWNEDTSTNRQSQCILSAEIRTPHYHYQDTSLIRTPHY